MVPVSELSRILKSPGVMTDKTRSMKSISVPRSYVDWVRDKLSLHVVPLTLKQANELVSTLHRHHKPAQGHRFSIGCEDNEGLHGAAICGRPVARGCDPYRTLEVVRLVTDGTPNACSLLYAASARIAKEMGFTKIQTYILDSEPGTSLKASGWLLEATTQGGDWNHSKSNQGTRRTDQPMSPKSRWARNLQ